ncbi:MULTISPECIES: hydrogenase nickel incorporation protein HypB [unclassified Kutzneria]|uniref:hydrogenase nickel incorporation protein HypB n=1 Tax=unclassified Kutzneria TaxID=2621979 RepID=UPI0003EEBB43|nr:hydrogenase nickel incorporation protein HypB [Kutzneria sp. 744]EWM09735.1 hydrogenase nickel incorporation protein HypB [Kutzneria sp. 744]
MCATCGCDDHSHEQGGGVVIDLEERLLARNDHLAGHIRDWLASIGVRSYNLMSSPGSGKTTLLERTVRELGLPCSVIEGDQETTFDADRIQATGVAAVQVNTGAGCHLDAVMVRKALASLDPAPGSVVFVENVGNLVCPALFDLGETGRVVILSVTEGEDKPLKYPHLVRTGDVVLLNKVDLLPYLDFSQDRFLRALRQVNPHAPLLPVSARTGEGLADWYAWLSR